MNAILKPILEKNIIKPNIDIKIDFPPQPLKGYKRNEPNP